MAEHRRLSGGKLVIATHNKGKLAEIAELIAPYGLEAIGADALGLPEPEETGASFEDNAALKALAAAQASNLPALADDSGLVVPALGGDPGIYSARWAGPGQDFTLAMDQVERELIGKTDRRAFFVAVLALAWPDARVESFRGEAHGNLAFPPRGQRGFGYDPIFVADGEQESFGEMDPARKHAISHRAKAFALFAKACLGATR
ncbi:MAG TPA: RdgB/HAM1 family non-canonical purine NTP pyrophosphatase [Stellaceae bacterium]|nr:RdgB/HAM1 family non-canonical purine NTP pyrophosphatase [Stellaceae bacterium]